MKSLEIVRSALKAHPVVAILTVALAALFSTALAAAGAVVLLACYFVPRLVERHAPDVAVASAVSSMRQHGLQVVQRTSAVMADEIALKRARDAELLQVSLWDTRAVKAAMRGDDEAALVALEQKAHHVMAAAALGAEIEKQRATVATMKPAVEKLRSRAAKAERSGLFLVIRRRRAEASKQTTLEGSGFDEQASAFERMEADVRRAEDEASATEELLRRPVAASVAERFEQEERDERLEQELADLKQRVGMRRPALEAKQSA